MRPPSRSGQKVKVVVTGGAGYVGYSLVSALLENPAVHDLVIYDNLARRQYSLLWNGNGGGRATFVEADILDGRSLDVALRDATAVVHLAATVHLPGRDNEAHAFDQVNNWGSAQVAAAIEQQPSISRAVYLSTVVVYGSSDVPLTTESSPQPNTFYGVTKLRGESHFSRLASARRQIHVVRAGNVYGLNPAARFDTVVNRFLLDGKFTRKLRIIGSGDQTRSFIDVARLGKSLAALLVSDLPSSLLNFVDTTCSISELTDVIRTIDPAVELLYVDQDMRMQNVDVVKSPELDDLIGPPTLEFSDTVKAEWDQLGI